MFSKALTFRLQKLINEQMRLRILIQYKLTLLASRGTYLIIVFVKVILIKDYNSIELLV